MLVLVSFGLVLLATILLVVGLLTDDGLTLIYLSIAASFTAAVVLYLAFRRARPKADTDAQPPEPIAPEGAEDEVEAPRNEPTAVTAVVAATPEVFAAASPDPDEELEDEPEPVAAETDAAVEVAAASDDWTSDDDWADDGEFDVEFPIADYDELTVAEIMPLLPQLYSDELGIVAERERSGQARASILARLDELAATGTEADALEAEVAGVAGVAAEEPAPAVDATRNETLATPRPASPAPQVPSLSDDDDEYEDIFPIADYDELSVDQIVPLLAMLEDDELEDVKGREAAGQGRKSVIAEIDRQLGLVEAADTGSDDGWADERPAVDATVQAEQAMGSALAIAGYDGLTVAQVRPLLAGLSHAELRAVLEHETARDNRRTIVADIERRLDGTPEPVAPAAPAATRTPRKTAIKKAAAKKVAARAVAPTKKAAAAAPTARKSAAKKSARATKKASAPRFPIAGYDELTVAQIRPRLNRLSNDQLLLVRAREESGAGRKTILNDIDGRLR